MFTAALITFRELIEISLLLSIVSAALKEYPYKNMVLGLGIAIGIIFSIFIASSFNYITYAFDGLGQELLNIFILSMAIICLGWTLYWINNQKNQILDRVTTKVSVNNEFLPLVMLVVFAVCREGAELVLFLGGVFVNDVNHEEVIGGVLFGVSFGALFGLIIYFGLLSIPYRKFFKIVNLLFILLASNMAAQIAANLTAGDFMDFFSQQAWDINWLLREGSYIGNILASVTGYNARPSILQVLFYFITFASFGFLSIRRRGK